jgi:DMSO/TMAO reductase YedYZ molybdopterin-dependent catalytic subunit
VSETPHATRRRFLAASAGAAVTSWLAPLARAGESGVRGVPSLPTVPSVPNAPRAAKVLATVPFVDEGTFPLDTTVGEGLARRRALDLASLSREAQVIPQEKFFVRTGCPEELPDTTSWMVRGHGLVAKPAEIPLESLKRQARDQGVHILECAGNSRAAHFGFLSAARWTGVPLDALLQRLGPLPRATQVLVSGYDEHAVGDPGSEPGASWIFGLDEVRKAGAFLATGMNGAPLAPDHGSPVRLLVPGWYGCTAIKWVNEIALLDDSAPATPQMKEFAGRTHQPSSGPRDEALVRSGQRPEGPPLARDFQPATIDAAAVPVRVEKLDAGNGRISYRIVGILWGARIPADTLRIRLGPQRTAAPVENVENSTGRPWTLWSHTFRPQAPGRYRIELAVSDPAVRTRRLDAGYYAREIEITSI